MELIWEDRHRVAAIENDCILLSRLQCTDESNGTFGPTALGAQKQPRWPLPGVSSDKRSRQKSLPSHHWRGSWCVDSLVLKVAVSKPFAADSSSMTSSKTTRDCRATDPNFQHMYKGHSAWKPHAVPSSGVWPGSASPLARYEGSSVSSVTKLKGDINGSRS